MSRLRMSQLPRETLKQMIVERRAELNRRDLEIIAATKALNILKREHYQFWDALKEAKEILGSMNGRDCPALKDGNTGYAAKNVVCFAKRYKYVTWCREDMYHKHCYTCHLTLEQARTAMLYDRILIGRRKDGQ